MKDILLILGDGHGASTPGKRTPLIDGKQIRENQFNRPIIDKLESMAKAMGFLVYQVAPEIETVSLKTMTDRANKRYREFIEAGGSRDRCLYISAHFNAYNGKFDNKKGGVETYAYSTKLDAYKIAQAVHSEIIKGTKQYDRGVKVANFHVLRETAMSAILIEYGFMDKMEEALLMLDEEFQNECARETLQGIMNYYGVKQGLPLASQPIATRDQLYVWAKNKGMCDEGLQLVDIYFDVCKPKGLNPIIQYVQMCHETGFLYKTKSAAGLDRTYHNPCGLKITQGGGDYQASAHKRFNNWYDGIDAHTDHSALYAGVKGYPRADTLDPRHFAWILGRAETVEELSGRWAPSLTYHKTLIKWHDEVVNTNVHIDFGNLELEGFKIKVALLQTKLQKINELSAL